MELEKLLGERPERPAIMGVGHPRRGDDAAGVELVRRLAGRTRAALVEAAEVPERYLGQVIEARPSLVLLADAVDFGAAPGTVALFGADELAGDGCSTHSISLRLTMDFLAAETGAPVYLLGIQPNSLAAGAPLSSAVERSLDALVRLLADWAPSEPPACPLLLSAFAGDDSAVVAKATMAKSAAPLRRVKSAARTEGSRPC